MIAEILVGGIVIYAIMKKNAESGTTPVAGGGTTHIPTPVVLHPQDPPTPLPMKKQTVWVGPDYYPNKIGYTNGIINCGGGGPENRGARPANAVTTKLPTTQPSWFYETEDEYFGPATKSHTPITAGGGLGQPRDAFRWLGDNFDARQ